MTYPAILEVETPEKIANWRPLVQWLMAIPHVIVIQLLNMIAFFVAVFSWFSILFTGTMSEGLANLQAMVQRYIIRTYAFAGFLHEEYPPFDFTTTAAEPGGTPVSVEFSPALENRDRLTVGLRLIWMIPAAIFSGIITFFAQVLIFFAVFAVLFTGVWPAGMRDFVVKALGVQLRFNSYVMLLTDEYPPFSLTD